MKLRIDDTEYDVQEAISGATLGDLMKLKVKTKTADFLGVTVKSIKSTFKDIGQRLQDDEEFDTLDLLGDEGFLINMQGLIYLARRKAGERIEVEDAGDTAFSSFGFIFDDDEADDETNEAGTSDPKAPASDPDESSPAA